MARLECNEFRLVRVNFEAIPKEPIHDCEETVLAFLEDGMMVGASGNDGAISEQVRLRAGTGSVSHFLIQDLLCISQRQSTIAARAALGPGEARVSRILGDVLDRH